MSRVKKGMIGLFKGKHHTVESNTKNSLAHKRLWDTDLYVRNQIKSRNICPNKTELRLGHIINRLTQNTYKYVGNGEVVIGAKCPDYININGQKKIIELFGDYWHKGENPEKRIKHFEKYGWGCLVIWEHELKDLEQLANKILLFEGSK